VNGLDHTNVLLHALPPTTKGTRVTNVIMLKMVTQLAHTMSDAWLMSQAGDPVGHLEPFFILP
jgi:hypothetical protein